MILFWLLCGLLVAISLAFVLPPLLKRNEKTENEDEGGRREANLAVFRDQLAELERDMSNELIDRDQFEQERDELERRVLEDVSPPIDGTPKQAKPAIASRSYIYVIALGIPVIAVGLYLRIGNLNAISATPAPTGRTAAQTMPEGMPRAEGQRSQEDIEANVAALAKKLEENPDDVQGWIMLGRSYMSFERYSDASEAYAKASALKPNDADLLADYAVALAMVSGQRLQGKPVELINKALKLEPENAKALELAGTAAFQEKDYKRALDYWQRLMAKLPPGSEVAKALSQQIEKAKTLAGDSKR